METNKMNMRKNFFLWSGIIKCVVCGGVIFIFGLMLLLSGVLKSAFLENSGYVTNFINELVAIDPSYAELQTKELSEQIDFMLGILNTFCIVVLVVAIIGIVLAIFNFRFMRHFDSIDKSNGRKIVFTILTLVLYWGVISNALSIVALFLKGKNDIEIISPKVSNL